MKKILLATLSVFACSAAAYQDAVDPSTVALWLFDESQYPNVTLTDAGPLQIDLRLNTGKPTSPQEVLDGKCGLVEGKFGRALQLPIGKGLGAIWPMDRSHGGSVPVPARGHYVPERCNLGYRDWTLEFWFKGTAPQSGRGAIFDLRSEAKPANDTIGDFTPGRNALLIDDGRKAFVLISKTLEGPKWNFELAIPTDAAKLNDGAWHHAAFTYSIDERQLNHYVDGKLQSLPGKGGFLPLKGRLISLLLGRDREDGDVLTGAIDEMRISEVIRYKNDFTPPESFSRNVSRAALAANGPALLFPPDGAKGPLPLGNRKHVFIDGALLEKVDDLKFNVNPPSQREATDFRCDKVWESAPRLGWGVCDPGSFWDDDGEIRFVYTNGGMWGGKPQAVCIAKSKDGLHWEKPELDVHGWEGFSRTNIILTNSCQGMAFKDQCPGVPAAEKYKFVAWCMTRGFYVFTSEDSIHWRRNECAALPFDPDGTISVWWDDQLGRYRALSRALDGPPQSDWYRGTVREEIPDLMKSWPFKPVKVPQWHAGGDFPLPKPTGGELPKLADVGQVYRHMAVKYPWAPDVYLAFPWRYVKEKNMRPGSFLMVSRDGEHWTPYEPPFYFPAGWELNGRTVIEALSEQGMVRRGDSIWQYGTVRFTEHGGAMYGGVEHEGSGFDRIIRLTQRLDGFVSLDGGEKTGTAVSKPVIFKGSQLVVNVDAKAGALRVALLDENSVEIPGFELASCDAISADSVRQAVQWKARPSLEKIAGKTVRIKLELRNAKLFALQFSDAKE